MKKRIITFVLLVASATVFAQGPIGKGEKQLNGGVGLSAWGIPVYVGLDYGVTPDISVGGEFSFRSYWGTIIGIDVNGNYHFNKLLSLPKPWDLYGGLNLGYYSWSASTGYTGSYSGVGVGLQVGGRYYFNNKFGVNVELGGATVASGLKLGVSYKF